MVRALKTSEVVRPRILHLGKFYPPVSGGMETVLETLCRGERASVDSRAIVLNTSRRTVYEWPDGVPVTRVGSLATIGSVAVAPTLPFHLARAQADVIVLHEPNPMALVAYAAARPRASLVVWYHSEVIRPVWRYATCYRPFLEVALRRAVRIVVASPPMLEVRALAPYRDKCVVVPYGLAIGRYHATPAVASRVEVLRRSARGPVLLFVGRLVRYKGVDVLLRALPGLAAEAVIVGDGPLRSALEDQARRLGVADRVRFVGEIAGEDVLAWYQACEALVLPSISRQEAFGIVQAEAMVCGRPVVSTDLPTGVPWVNQHEVTGLVVPPGDAAALRRALDRLLRDAALRRRLGVAARARALGEFADRRMCASMVALYQELCPAPVVRRPDAVRARAIC